VPGSTIIPRVCVVGMTKEQAEALPEFSLIAWRLRYESKVRGVYRTQSPLVSSTCTALAAVPSNPLITAIPTHTEQDASHMIWMPTMIKLLQERLVANKIRAKTEVTIVALKLKLHGFQYRLKTVVIERVTPATLAGQSLLVVTSKAKWRASNLLRDC